MLFSVPYYYYHYIVWHIFYFPPYQHQQTPTRRNYQATVADWQPASANLARTKYGNVEHDDAENTDDATEDSIDQLRHGDKERGSFCDGIW